MLVVVYLSIFLLYLYFTAQCYLRRSWIGLILSLAFLIRAIVCLFFLTDLQLIFVLDGKGFEFEAWNLAKSWASEIPGNYVKISNLGDINLYKLLLAGIFYFFGKEPLLGMLLNSLFATLNIFLIYRIVEKFFMFSKVLSEFDITEKSLAALALTFYPSFIIWSATNIRDPLYFLSCTIFFYYWLAVFSKNSSWHFGQKSLGWVGILISFLLILSIRLYIGVFFLSSIVLGVLINMLIKKIGFKRALVLFILLTSFSAIVLQYVLTDLTNQGLLTLAKVRESFSNAGYDDAAASSFDLDYQFNTIWDVFLFIPRALSNYFFGPFLWNLTSILQGLAQLEVLLVYFLTIPTVIGIKKAYKYARFETVTIVIFCFTMAVFQAMTISNLGTLFRHRTLAFILLSIFSGVGLMEIRRRVIVRHRGR